MFKYYKKIIEEKPWTQPILKDNSTSAGNLGKGEFGIRCSEYKGRQSYLASDGNLNTFADTSDGTYSFYSKSPLKISSIIVYTASVTYAPYVVKLYASEADSNYIEIATGNNSTHSATFTINVTGIDRYNYFKIIATSLPYPNYYDVRELKINATQMGTTWQECTKEEYDQLPDDQRKIVTGCYVFQKKNENVNYIVKVT